MFVAESASVLPCIFRPWAAPAPPWTAASTVVHLRDRIDPAARRSALWLAHALLAKAHPGGAFGWKGSRLAVERIHEALTEIRGVARTDPILAAEGAVRLIERLSPALEHIDSSSGAIGSAVNGAIGELVPLIAAAPVEPKVRQKWLERLFVAHAED